VEHSYKIGDARFGIRTTSEAFGQWLEETLAQYRVKRRAEPYLSVVVADGAKERRGAKREFHILYANSSTIARTLDLHALARSLFAELEALRFGERDDAIFLDAVVVRADGHAALVPASVAANIGSLGGRVKRAGLSVPDVRRVAVDIDSGLVGPVRRTLDIHIDALDRLSAFVPTNGRRARPERDEPVAVDIICTLGKRGDLLVEPAPRSLTLMRLASMAGNVEKLGGSALEGLRRMVVPARCYAMDWADAPTTLDAISGIVGTRSLG